MKTHVNKKNYNKNFDVKSNNKDLISKNKN